MGATWTGAAWTGATTGAISTGAGCGTAFRTFRCCCPISGFGCATALAENEVNTPSPHQATTPRDSALHARVFNSVCFFMIVTFLAVNPVSLKSSPFAALPYGFGCIVEFGTGNAGWLAFVDYGSNGNALLRQP